MKDKIHELLKKAKSEKKAGNIKVAIGSLEEAKEQLLQGEEGSKQSRRNDTSGNEDEIIYLYKYGNILYEVGEYRRALKYYEELVEQQPSVNTYKALGDCFRKLNVYDTALDKYKKALEEYDADPTNPADKAAVLNSRGLTYMVKATDPNSYGSTSYTPKMDNKKALKDFKKTIELSEPNNPNPLYHCNKGVILYTLDKKEEGLNCFKKAIKLVNAGKDKELTKQNINYIKNPLLYFTELEGKVQEIQAQFKAIQNKLNTEQLQQEPREDYNKLQEDYNRLQKDHNELLEVVKSNILKQEDINSLSETGHEELTKKMDQVTTDLNQLKHDIQVVEKDIADIKEQLPNLVTKEQFEELAAKNEITYNMFDNKFRMLEIEVNRVKKWQVYIDDTLTEANVFVEVETKSKFELLERDHGKEVYEYATKFYWALSDSLQAYRMISTGLIKENSDDYTGVVGKISKGLSVASKISKVSGAVDKVVLSLSIAGGIIDIANGFYKEYSEVKLGRIAKKVVDSICGPILEKDLNLAIASSAIEIAIAKKHTITDTATQELTKMEEVQKWFNNKLEKLASKITQIKAVPPSNVTKMALEDVSLFIIKSIIKSDDKLVESTEDTKNLDQKIECLFKGDVAMKQLFTKLYDKIHSKESANVIAAYMVHEVVYDNPLLNNLELIKDAAKLLGFNFNNALNLSKELSRDLITEAIENNDSTVVLRGLLNLVESSEECI